MKGILNLVKLISKYGTLIMALIKAIEVLKDEVEKIEKKDAKSIED